ncbi:IS4 family transposase [Fulvivirgaceae bacterium BMA12]|uniref:IS4 family transposase n=1 Tax=Agaribacillus aureus TaxID=3051825 RepID=A0ABT8LJ76_9BACT|nr:IS4 family transposase [Fulvivirgaceae bacterium BMA12]
MLSENFRQTLDAALIEELAKKTGFVQRSSKLTGKHFLEMIMFCNLQAVPASLNDFSAYLFEEHNIKISKQGLDERFNETAVNFLKRLLTVQLEKSIQSYLPKGYCPTFNRVRVKDSTKWTLSDTCIDKYKGYGGNKQQPSSMVSVQYEYDLLSGKIIDLSVHSGTRNDLQDAKELKDNIGPDDLIIRDLGYISSSYLENIKKKGAFFLNRLSPQLGVYHVNNHQRRIDFKDIAKTMINKNLDYFDQQVLVGSQQYHRCRMIVTKVSEQIYQQRIAKAKRRAKDRRHRISEEYKSRAKLNVYLTNVDEKKMLADMVVKLYKVRWQIELIFKVWKSLAKVNAVSRVKTERFECQLLAKLIWLLTNWKVFSIINDWMLNQKLKSMCSIWKFFKQAIRKPLQLRDVLWRQNSINLWLRSIFEKAHTYLSVERKKGKIPFFDLYCYLSQLT